jgi:hypothetical protein
MERRARLDQLIVQWAGRLRLPPGSEVDPVKLLKALAWKESTYGQNTTPLKEPAYCPGGRYFTDDQAQAWQQYGEAAACSYSSFQILYPTAVEMGYRDAPQGLDDDAEAIRWVVELLNRRVLGRDQARTVQQIGDAYNSGTSRDQRQPLVYMQALQAHYDRMG